jgi:hypothetical protein
MVLKSVETDKPLGGAEKGHLSECVGGGHDVGICAYEPLGLLSCVAIRYLIATYAGFIRSNSLCSFDALLIAN